MALIHIALFDTKTLCIDILKYFQDVFSFHKVLAPKETDMESFRLEPSTVVIVDYSHGFEFFSD